jgi:predicted peptidase
MNALILALTCALAPGEDVVANFSEHTYKYTGGRYQDEVFRYRLLSPEKIEPGKKYPVILFLHGAGERGDDNADQLIYLPQQMATAEYRKKFPCFLIAPQCREEGSWVERRADSGTVGDQMQVVEGILHDVLKKYPCDPKRVYLTGLSMGGYGAWDLASRHPDWFAAVAPICGGGDPGRADRLVKVPIWAFHGDKDGVVRPEQSREMIEAIRAAGGNPKYTEFKDVGHDSWNPAYKDPEGVIPWLFSQVNDRGTPAQ